MLAVGMLGLVIDTDGKRAITAPERIEVETGMHDRAYAVDHGHVGLGRYTFEQARL